MSPHFSAPQEIKWMDLHHLLKGLDLQAELQKGLVLFLFDIMSEAAGRW